MPIVFLSRAKPQGCDAFPIFEQACRVFLGYPLCPDWTAYDPVALRSCLVNPLTCPKDEWNTAVKNDPNRRMFTRYQNLIREVEDGRKGCGMAMIPRPIEGVVHVGRITGPFEIVDAPPWGQDYLDLRERSGLDCDDESGHHVADVAQGWPVDKFRRIDFSSLPGWMRRATSGRTAVEVLPPHPLDPAVTAYQVLDRILDGAPTFQQELTLALDEIERRLVDVLNPYSFENLVVSLLQLEYLEEFWQHTGGPGDGGIDGIGRNCAGNTAGLLKVKFSADRAPEFVRDSEDEHVRRFVAVLLPKNPRWPDDGAEHLGLEWIARKVQEHWQRLPLATTIRVGEGGDHAGEGEH